jgi:hypothetical protein
VGDYWVWNQQEVGGGKERVKGEESDQSTFYALWKNHNKTHFKKT